MSLGDVPQKLDSQYERAFDKSKRIKDLEEREQKYKKALDVSKKAITILSDQILGINIAFKVHGTNLNDRFFIEITQSQYESGRQALKEIEEVFKNE